MKKALFVGSNNLTDGGFYTNYEAAVRYDFEFPADVAEYERLVRPLVPFLEPQEGPTVQRLTARLIETLVARGELPSEADARQRRRAQAAARRRDGGNLPQSPFAPVATPRAPLLSDALRREEPGPVAPQPPPAQPAGQPQPAAAARPAGVLVWRRSLSPTAALQKLRGNPVGGVPLTQAKFEISPGHRIDQTVYFRQLFADYPWQPEARGCPGQEYASIPMRIIIRGRDFGVQNFEVSHKPTGEAGQDNYTTILRWGPFAHTVRQENLAGAIFSLYEIAEPDADFLIEITEA